MIKLWGGRFKSSSSDITERLSASIHYDCRLYKHDIIGSIAHAKMLKKIGILTDSELSDITNGLKRIEAEIDNGEFEFSSSLEDIHMNIESKLTEYIGDAGKKLHTARSRNDQVALDMRLYLRDEVGLIDELLKKLILSLIELAKQNKHVILPGYTHLQVAQVVRFSHHILAYVWQLVRDRERLHFVQKSCSSMPLGAGALAGVNYNTDREYLKEELNFEILTMNSMDAVSDRDFILDFLYFASVLGTHLSRFCEDIILWSSSEFNFIRLDDAVTTGSSIMPQKRNPDLAELIRGKTGRLNGNLVAMLTILKGLPMTYNRDLQEDKERMFDSIDTVKLSLEGFIEMFKNIKINDDVMQKAVFRNFSTATDLADYLTNKKVPFRKSHEIVGSIVKYCEKNGVDFFAMSVQDLKRFSDVFEDDITEILNPKNSTERKLSIGSTSVLQVERQIEMLEGML